MMLDVDGPDGTREWGMGLSTAQEIVKTCEDYPLELVGLAEQICRSELAENIVPVSDVAQRDGWFVESQTKPPGA